MEPEPDALPEGAYPVEDAVPETLLHLRIRTMLYTLVRRYLAEQGIRALTGSEQFLYWVEGNSQRTVAPDVYVVLGVPPDRDVRTWQTWREGKAPELAIEIVSDDVGKDYETGPRRYAEAGVQELVIFDPFEGADRIRWQVYVRRSDGELVRTISTQADRVPSTVLGCHLRHVEEEGQPRVRLGVGAQGQQLVPTAEEAEDRERAAKEQERALRLAAQAELEALRRRLADDRSD
ncbi:MAG: Uma2 family endonuclease [Myxococcota bacterium]